MSSNHKSEAITSGYEKIHPAILSDSLDDLGISNQVMSIKMRPLDVSLVLLGRARTGAYMEVPYLTEGINPYELEITLVDDLKKMTLQFLLVVDQNKLHLGEVYYQLLQFLENQLDVLLMGMLEIS